MAVGTTAVTIHQLTITEKQFKKVGQEVIDLEWGSINDSFPDHVGRNKIGGRDWRKDMHEEKYGGKRRGTLGDDPQTAGKYTMTSF
ncbi:unnamed protein product [Onchocerca flexuosa]|uniref:Cytotoxic domain-containing protein n=1 Tax=Onchocerca flexuosa TaxID=387005 RepID=A0A183H296_9BILA|nr:unnamed protein product [Onchocerca flexuosa]